MSRQRRVDLPPMGEEPDDGSAWQGGPTRTEEALGRLIRERAQLMEAITHLVSVFTLRGGPIHDESRVRALLAASGLVDRLRAGDEMRQRR